MPVIFVPFLPALILWYGRPSNFRPGNSGMSGCRKWNKELAQTWVFWHRAMAFLCFVGFAGLAFVATTIPKDLTTKNTLMIAFGLLSLFYTRAFIKKAKEWKRVLETEF